MAYSKSSKWWEKLLRLELGHCASCGSRSERTTCKRCDNKPGDIAFTPDRRRNSEELLRVEAPDTDVFSE